MKIVQFVLDFAVKKCLFMTKSTQNRKTVEGEEK